MSKCFFFHFLVFLFWFSYQDFFEIVLAFVSGLVDRQVGSHSGTSSHCVLCLALQQDDPFQMSSSALYSSSLSFASILQVQRSKVESAFQR